MRRILKATVVIVGALAVVGGVLFGVFGLRVVLDGGATPHLRFVEAAGDQAERIRRHREAQRTSIEPPAVTTAPVPATQAGNERAAAAPPRLPEAAASRPRAAGAPPYWTDFRGPARDGHYREQPVVTAWPASGLRPLWKQPIGGGYASFVVARGRAFTIEQRGPDEVVAAYDVETGRELWTNAWPAEFRELLGGDGPRATPTWSAGRVYALGALGELRALDEATGRVLWRTNILRDSGATNLTWGMAASPLVVGETVIVLPGGPNGQSVVAYDHQSGKRVWSALADRQAYSSPMLVTLAGVRQVLVLSAARLMGLTERGEVLWEYPWPGPNDGINAAQPLVIGDNRVYVSSGYGMGAAVIEVSAGPSGFSVRDVWRSTRMKNRFASAVFHDGFIYGLDESILACIDAGTGALKWKGGRYGHGQVLLASGHLIVLTEDGDLALVRATPDRLEEIARFPVLSGKTWNVPALAGGYLFVRNLAETAAFDLRVPAR